MKTELAVTEEELQQILSESAFANIYKFALHSFGRGECALMIPFQPAMERPGGIIAGTVYMTAADVAMWLAIMTLFGKDGLTVTTELKTTFLNAARQEDIKCTARILKPGKRLVYGVAECANLAGKLITHHTITYMRIDK